MGLAMVGKDLQRAATYLNAVLRSPDDDDAELRWHGAVMAYGRCFAEAAGRSFSLDKQHVKTLDAKAQKTHGRVIALRHQYVAHSGINDEQRPRAVIVVVGPFDSLTVEQTLVTDVTVVRPHEAELQDFLALVEAFQDKVRVLFDQTEISVVEHYASKTQEELSALLKAHERARAD